VIVLGFDGMDYDLTREMMAEGRLPHLSRLAAEGTFSSLATSIPPQSPVAWSDFMTGMDGGGHGIFDFIHRDPKSMLPEFSMGRALPGGRALKIGKYQFPLSSGTVELLRRGEAFWEVLEREGIETSIIRIPANFPPSGAAHCELSGMGTPDVEGSYGMFSFYTTDSRTWAGADPSGGRVHIVYVQGDRVEGTLSGPTNPFLVKPEKVTVDFEVFIDPVEPVTKIVVGDEERILQVGEWSDWVPIEFEFIPTQTLPAIARFHLKQVRPDFELYVTPINFDPLEPAMPISTPPGYATELAEATGRYYTQGLPEDTQALRGHVLTRAEFLQQARLAGEDILRQYPHVLDGFEEGLLFYYFGNVDQISHMMWRPMDPDHPAYDPVADPPFADAVKSVYEQMDEVVGYTLERMGDETLLVVMSDHGFTSFRRAFNPNTWLMENGYLALIDPSKQDRLGIFGRNTAWSRTRAYALGINGLYINLAGRERWGIVSPEERQALMEEIAEKLLAVVDPATGERAITKVYLREETFEDHGYREIGPDIVIGYAKMTRASDEASLGKIGPEVFSDNTEEWGGCHLMDHETVPGVLFTNRPLKKPAPRLQDLAAAILAEYGIEGFPSPKAKQ
jgi:predicted AlkP superfamily phosphohydrolase/phosphomutase